MCCEQCVMRCRASVQLLATTQHDMPCIKQCSLACTKTHGLQPGSLSLRMVQKGTRQSSDGSAHLALAWGVFLCIVAQPPAQKVLWRLHTAVSTCRCPANAPQRTNTPRTAEVQDKVNEVKGNRTTHGATLQHVPPEQLRFDV